MEKAILLSPAYGWFAGLLTVMVIVTALFALILVIALKPIKKDEFDDSSSARKALGRRETELTIELLNKQNDAQKRAELESKLREVKAAEKLVEELVPEEEKPAPKKPLINKAPAAKQPAAAPQKPVKAPKTPPQPAKAPEAKPAEKVEKPEQPAQENKQQENKQQENK